MKGSSREAVIRASMSAVAADSEILPLVRSCSVEPWIKCGWGGFGKYFILFVAITVHLVLLN